MAIETFLIEEAEALITDVELNEEWKQKVEELGLEGQKSLCNPGKSPIPFVRLKKGEERMFEELCPNRTSVKDYKEDTIPLRVLSLIALAEKEGYFGKIEIWHNYGSPDPIAVGYKKNSEGKADKWTNDGIFIIARWGDELRSFAELLSIAKKQWIETQKTILQEKLNAIESIANRYFKGEWVNI